MLLSKLIVFGLAYAMTASATGLPYVFEGCYHQRESGYIRHRPDLSPPPKTVMDLTPCKVLCASNDESYFASGAGQGEQCFCGSSLPKESSKLEDSYCRNLVDGGYIGAAWIIAVYREVPLAVATCTESKMTCPVPEEWQHIKYTLPTRHMFNITVHPPVELIGTRNPECDPSNTTFTFTKEQCGSHQVFNKKRALQEDWVRLVPFGKAELLKNNTLIGLSKYKPEHKIEWELEGNGDCKAGNVTDGPCGISDQGLNCQAICSARGYTGCDQGSIDDLNSVEKIHDAFEKAGFVCNPARNDMGCQWKYNSTSVKDICKRWGSPYLYNRFDFIEERRCFFGNGVSHDHASCTQDHVDKYHRRLCPCIPTTTTTTTTTTRTCEFERAAYCLNYENPLIKHRGIADAAACQDKCAANAQCNYGYWDFMLDCRLYASESDCGNKMPHSRTSMFSCTPVPTTRLLSIAGNSAGNDKQLQLFRGLGDGAPSPNFVFTNTTSKIVPIAPDIICKCEMAYTAKSVGYDYWGNFVPYPGTDQNTKVGGSVWISTDGTKQTLHYSLTDIEKNCKECKIRIHSGDNCQEEDGPEGPLWTADDSVAVYNGKEDSKAEGSFTIITKSSIKDRVVVVYKENGSKFACAELRADSSMALVEEEAPNMIRDKDVDIEGESTLVAHLSIFKDQHFLQMYENTYDQSYDRADVSTEEYIPDTTDPRVTKKLFIEVATSWTENHVTIRNCWAAPTKDSLDKEDSNSVRFYSKYCSANPFEAKPEENKDLHHLSRLSVRKFKFDGTEQLWMKCEIVACKKAPCGTCGDGPRYPHLEDEKKMRSMMVTFGDMNKRTLKSGENSLVKMFENKKRSLQSQISAGSNKSNIFAVKVPRHASRQEYLVLPRSIQHSASNPTSSLLTTMFGPTELEKGIKIEKLLDRKTQIAFHHGRVEGSLVLGAPADKWATDINARKSLENTLEAILNLSAKERVHVLSVGRVTVNDRRSLMRFKRILSTGSAGVSQVDYAIELAADSDTALVSGAVMSLSLGESDTTQFITRLNQELLSSGSTPVPPKAMLGFGMPLTYKEASNVGATGHDPSGADGHTTVVYTFSSGTRPAYDKYGVSIAERDEADTNSSTAQAGFDSSALMYMLYGFGGIVGLCALAHGGKHLYKKYTAHSKRNTVQKFGSVLPEQQINNWTPPGSDIITVPNTELAMARKLEMNYPMTVIPGEKPDVALELASKVSTASPKSGDIGDGQSSHGSQDLKALTPLN